MVLLSVNLSSVLKQMLTVGVSEIVEEIIERIELELIMIDGISEDVDEIIAMIELE